MQRYTARMTKQNMNLFNLLESEPVVVEPAANTLAKSLRLQRLLATLFIRLPQTQLRMLIA
ncbi:MAG: hypothetical protein JJT87_07060 [Halomonas sp.]|uniref:hypothetical protein n=1 Tax=unclassified Halomonas TaxID=2609666 RepID=UPI0009909CFF|nr:MULTISPECIES: hypothetical protein [unclassified Halomonas]AQU83083.1 hypothetical protein B2G49_11220 [Halomonas sp. 'Soap Lake \